jgi:hypothetical protein
LVGLNKSTGTAATATAESWASASGSTTSNNHIIHSLNFSGSNTASKTEHFISKISHLFPYASLAASVVKKNLIPNNFASAVRVSPASEISL